MEKRILDHKAVCTLLPQRNPYTHKGDYGKILLICGSLGYTGAAALASMGALRSGAGLVYLAVPECIYAIEAAKLTEPIVLPLPDEDGKVSKAAYKDICTLLQGKDAVLIGPGIGQSEGTLAAVRTVLESFSGPVVLDADGINVICAHTDILRGREAPTILTPHDGEFFRLGGSLSHGRLEGAAELAKTLGVIVLLKGHETLITDGNLCYENHTGNAGMAVGGSGDVLAGILVSLLGQALPPMEAAACAAYLHGAAGDICRDEIGEYGMLPTDMLNALPRLLK